jgi:WD40 repeat protein
MSYLSNKITITLTTGTQRPNCRADHMFLIIATSCLNSEQDLLLVDAQTGNSLLRLEDHTRSVSVAAFSVDGSKLASGSRDGTCKVWDSSTGALLRTIDGFGGEMSMAWGRDFVRDIETRVTFSMGHHQRLGARSHVMRLDEELLRMILDHA